MKIVATNVVASRPPNGDWLQRRPLVPEDVDVHSEQTNLLVKETKHQTSDSIFISPKLPWDFLPKSYDH